MKRYRNILIVLAIVVLVLAFAVNIFFKSQMLSVMGVIGKPFYYVSTNVKSFFRDIGSLQTLSKENSDLKAKNNELEAKIASLKETEIDNGKLASELNFVKSHSSLNLVGAQVIFKSVIPYLKTIMIDKGSDDGIQKDDVVLSQGHLVGVVSEIFANNAYVDLITSGKILIPVILQDSRSTGILKSQLEGMFIEDIPIDDKVAVDENVLTSNLDANIPSDLIVGTVDKIIASKSQIFQTIKVKSPVEFSKLDFVFVVKK